MKFFIASALLAVGYTVSRLARSQQVSNDAHEAIDTIPEAATGVTALTIKPYEPDNSARTGSITSGERNLDIGIFPRNNPEEQDTSFINSRRLQASSCTVDSVVCDNGFNADNSSQTCADACAPGNCCVGTKACDNFTGTVCMDGESCMGDEACYYANITGFVDNSCNGAYACAYAAASYTNYYSGDYVGPGRINDISNSCIGFRSCLRMASQDGYVGSISNSCNGTYACHFMGGFNGNIGTVADSCVGDTACFATAYDGGVIENITSSCKGDYACFGAAFYGGSILGFREACNADKACRNMARRVSIPIDSVLDSCCNEATACADQDTLPGECVAPSTSPSPSYSPSASPTESAKPTSAPSTSPTESAKPTLAPSSSPTESAKPTSSPSVSPTESAKPTAKAAKKGAKGGKVAKAINAEKKGEKAGQGVDTAGAEIFV